MAGIEEAVGALARLVAFDTTSRNGNLDLIRWAEAGLAAHGIASRLTYDAAGTKANLHAVIGPRVAGGVALSGHVDCVPVDGQAWRADPFALRREGGRLVGRGTTDMKGFVACMLAMAPAFAARGLKRPVHLCLTFDEETTFAGAPILVAALGADGPLPEMCVVGEPTLMAPVVAHKGYTSWNAVVTGVTGHSSHTDATANALHAAAEAVAWLAARGRAFAAGPRTPGFDPPHSTVHAGIFHSGGTALNVVPDRADFAFEVRTVPGDDAASVLEGLCAHLDAAVLPALRAVDPSCGATFAVRAAAPPLGTAEDAPVVRLAQALSGHRTAGRVSYGTEAGFYAAAGIPTVVCGPGSIAQAHQPEEWVAESELADCMAFLGRLADRLAA